MGANHITGGVPGNSNITTPTSPLDPAPNHVPPASNAAAASQAPHAYSKQSKTLPAFVHVPKGIRAHKTDAGITTGNGVTDASGKAQADWNRHWPSLTSLTRSSEPGQVLLNRMLWPFHMLGAQYRHLYGSQRSAMLSFLKEYFQKTPLLAAAPGMLAAINPAHMEEHDRDAVFKIWQGLDFRRPEVITHEASPLQRGWGPNLNSFNPEQCNEIAGVLIDSNSRREFSYLAPVFNKLPPVRQQELLDADAKPMGR